MDHLCGVVEAAAEVDRADHGLDRVGEDRGLVAAAGRLLALAELDVIAQADGAGHLGQGAGVDDGRPQLGQQPLGQRGLGEVEGLGDDHPEHRVAEELQPLVGGQATVLVRIGPVRQGKVQQLVGQLRTAELLAQRVQPVVRRGGRVRRGAGGCQRT
jgi:hypothetical protein